MECLCGSRTDTNKANQDGVTPLRTVVLQQLEEMMDTFNHLDIAGGVAGKSSYNIVAGSVDVQVLPEELDEQVAKVHLHLCAPQLATCPSRCRVHSGTRYWRRSISSRKELDEMLTWCQKFFTRWSYAQRAFQRLRKKYGVELHRDNLSLCS